MQSDANLNKGGKLEQESLLPELLHALNQPLTSLRCSLEVTLLQPRDSEEYRRRLRESLKLTEDIMVLSRGIRELIDVEQPCSAARAIALDKVLRSAVREMLPLTDVQGIELSLLCEPLPNVLADEQQFFMAAMYFLSFLLSFANTGDEVCVRGSADGHDVALTFELMKEKSRKPSNPETEPGPRPPETPATASAYLKLLVARRIFEVARGAVDVERDLGKVAVHVRLPRMSYAAQEPPSVPVDQPSLLQS